MVNALLCKRCASVYVGLIDMAPFGNQADQFLHMVNVMECFPHPLLGWGGCEGRPALLDAAHLLPTLLAEACLPDAGCARNQTPQHETTWGKCEAGVGAGVPGGRGLGGFLQQYTAVVWSSRF